LPLGHRQRRKAEVREGSPRPPPNPSDAGRLARNDCENISWFRIYLNEQAKPHVMASVGGLQRLHCGFSADAIRGAATISASARADGNRQDFGVSLRESTNQDERLRQV